MKFEINAKLLELLNNNDFLSYQKISDNLKITHINISKQINYLKKLGYEIEFVKNKGYHLIFKPDIIIPEEIRLGLDTEIVGKDIFYFKSITSTNIFAKQIAEKGINEGAIVIADVQTHGRGRKNRIWFSDNGGLWFSIILRPKILAERGMFLTMVASISIAKAIKEISSINPVIKWPNDILINGKKICGILTEFDTRNNIINYVIIGIGTNVNNIIRKELKKIATSLSIEIGLEIPRVKFLRVILKHFDENYKKLIIGDFITIKNLWSSYSNLIGKLVKIEDNGKTISGIISDIDNKGCLILKNKNGIYKICNGDLYYL